MPKIVTLILTDDEHAKLEERCAALNAELAEAHVRLAVCTSRAAVVVGVLPPSGTAATCRWIGLLQPENGLRCPECGQTARLLPSEETVYTPTSYALDVLLDALGLEASRGAPRPLELEAVPPIVDFKFTPPDDDTGGKS